MSLYLPHVPEDFDAFWSEAFEEAKAKPLNFRRSGSNDFQHHTHRIETFTFMGMSSPLHGWIAYPEEARRMPAFIWIPPYGRESLLPNQYGTRVEFVSLSFNFFGHEAFHQETYVKERGYFSQGASSPETWIFREMAQNVLIALRVLQAQTEVDEARIGAMGLSQGAGMAIWTGALSPIVKAVCADMPFLGAMPNTLSRTAYRYPLKELIDFMDTIPVGRETVLHTLSYFDSVHLASRCRIPTQVSLGLKDPASRPDAVESIYEALPGEKNLIRYDWGHDWHPEMIENNRRWLGEWLR